MRKQWKSNENSTLFQFTHSHNKMLTFVSQKKNQRAEPRKGHQTAETAV
jgi:hypothetical protein